MADGDDSQETLLKISKRHKQRIAPLLLEIHREGYSERQKQARGFLENLECFGLESHGSNILRRVWINAFEERSYVALSYTWRPSDYEDQANGDYFIEDRQRNKEWPSPVRNCVFTRITKYMKSRGVRLLWIDKHSIKQRSYTTPDGLKKEPVEKQQALNCMDWVYKLSKHPVALLGRPLASRRELELLHMVLLGDIVIRRNMSDGQCKDVRETLKLLHAITDDLWWQRAWTFQENYKGGKEMTLLITHPKSCERLKRQLRIFGDIPRELCVNSVGFSNQVTNLCLSICSILSPSGIIKEMIDSILSKAGKYNIMLPESQVMSPTIIADVEKRSVTDVWDRLPIVGNCCSYPVRLDTERLRKGQRSLSLSMLAMYLLNGEILNNALSNKNTSLNVTTSSFLKAQTFGGIISPEGENSLTFNKGCRFIKVKLNERGILTQGHLWRLDRIIDTNQFSNRLQWVQKSKGSLTRGERQYLTLLCRALRKSSSSSTLAKFITTYLKRDADGNADFEFGENYMRMMMIEVARAIEAGKKLILGTLGGSRESTAVFILEGGDTSGFVFTASRTKGSDPEDYISNDTDIHVSVEVDCAPSTEWFIENPPLLHVKRWILGICFFVGCKREKVLFPWPRAFTDENV